jgi:hypothetical protein
LKKKLFRFVLLLLSTFKVKFSGSIKGLNVLDFLCDPPNSSVRTVWGNGRRMNYRRHARLFKEIEMLKGCIVFGKTQK